jgi:hypothetical protein
MKLVQQARRMAASCLERDGFFKMVARRENKTGEETEGPHVLRVIGRELPTRGPWGAWEQE